MSYATPVPLAWADGTSIDGSVRISSSVDSNRNRTGAPEETISASTTLGLSIQHKTPRLEVAIVPSISAFAVTGEGAEGEDLTRLDPAVETNFLYRGQRYQATAGTRFTARPASTEQLEDEGDGVTNIDTTQLTVNVNSALAYVLDPRNEVTIGGTATLIRFTDAGTLLTPITTYGGTLGWTHTSTPDTSMGLNLGLRRFSAENTQQSRSLTTDISGSVSHSVNEALSLEGLLGTTITQTTQQNAGVEQSSVNVGLTAGADVEYQATRDTQLQFEFAQSLEPSTLGQLQLITRGGFGIDYDINSMTDAGFDIQYIRRTSSGGFEDSSSERQTLRISPSLGFELTREWELNLRYEMILTQSDSGDGMAHRGIIQIARDFVILP